MSQDVPLSLAKITWQHPETGEVQEFVLTEGATVSIGRSANNDISIPEQHVSRQHAVINYRDGVFLINDFNSANGTFVNDQRVTEPFPLISGDEIRLYVPKLLFSAAVTTADTERAIELGKLITATVSSGGGKVIITNGPQEGEVIQLNRNEVTVGRATTNYTWEIGLQDASVSRPHAKFVRMETRWVIYDLGSSNGTMVNNTVITEKGRVLADGDVLSMGNTLILFRSN